MRDKGKHRIRMMQITMHHPTGILHGNLGSPHVTAHTQTGHLGFAFKIFNRKILDITLCRKIHHTKQQFEQDSSSNGDAEA